MKEIKSLAIICGLWLFISTFAALLGKAIFGQGTADIVAYFGSMVISGLFILVIHLNRNSHRYD